MNEIMKKMNYMVVALVLYILTISMPDQVRAELNHSEVMAGDRQVVGTTEPGQELMLLHRGAWMSTTAKSDGGFKFDLPSTAGHEALFLKGKKKDGFYDAGQSIVPKGNAFAPPLYLGRNGKESLFRSVLPDSEIHLLAGGNLFEAMGSVSLPEMSGVDRAYVYSSYFGIKSETKEIVLAEKPVIPFTLQASEVGRYYLKGNTVPYTKITVTYADDTYLPRYQTILSDEAGDFDARLDYPIELINQQKKVTFNLSLQVGEGVALPDALKKTYELKVPVLSGTEPLILSKEFVTSDERVTGYTIPGNEIEIVQNGEIRKCSPVQGDGRFDCGELAEDAKTIEIMTKKNAVTDYKKKFKVYQTKDESGNHQVEWTNPTSDSDVLKGKIDRRFADVQIRFSSPRDNYIMQTETDEEGRFEVKYPKTIAGTFSVFVSQKNGTADYKHVDTKEIKDVRRPPTPTYSYRSGKLTVYKGDFSGSPLRTQVTVMHPDGTFEFFKEEYPSSFQYDVIGVKKEDKIILKTISPTGIESQTVEGTIPAIDLDYLTQEAMKITGRTIPFGKLFLLVTKNRETKKIEFTSDVDGRFVIDYSRLYEDGFGLPKELGLILDDKHIIYESVVIHDVTAPSISVQPLRYNDSYISLKVLPQPFNMREEMDRVNIKIIFLDGRTEEWEERDNVSSYEANHEFYLRGTDLSKVSKIAVSAIDFAGNTSQPFIVIPIDTTSPDLAQIEVPIVNDTHVRGKGQPDTKVIVEIDGKRFLGMTKDDGTFDVPVDKLIMDQRVRIQLQEIRSGNVSPYMERFVLGIKSISLKSNRKTVIIKTNMDKNKYGSIGVYMILDNVERKIVLNRSSKSYSLPRSLKNHESVKFRVVSAKGEKIEDIVQKFSDTTPPAKPARLYFDNSDHRVKGKYVFFARVEPYASLQLMKNGKVVFRGNTDEFGNIYYQVSEPVDLKATWSFRITDLVGLSTTGRVYPKDVIPPKKPTMTTVTTQSTTLSGSTNEESKIHIVIGEKTLTTKTDKNGKFSFKIKPLKINTKLSVYAKDSSGNQSDLISVRVKGVQTLKVSELTTKSSSITGTGTPGAAIVLESVTRQTIAKTSVDNKGNFKMKIPRQKKGAVLYLVSTKSSYLTRETKIVIKK
ncbi:Ig-like domain-containing protein [Exiguobacterium sp. s191]|uniref:Ig-like domain-containing protein n=1 Tax=Exiguobacterium sp. s191 TaxID=2751196 RepID=UPI001BEA1E34